MQSPPGDDGYTGGSFWFNNNITFPPLFTPNATWTTFNNDLAFALSFTSQSVPEPSTPVLAALSLAVVGLTASVRRRLRPRAR
jgi:hypothetical protein